MLLSNIEVDEGTEVDNEVVMDDGADVLGDRRCSSLLALFLEGGLGEGEAADVRGDEADL